MLTACGSWRRAWQRVGKAEVDMEVAEVDMEVAEVDMEVAEVDLEVDAEVVEEKEEKEKKENNSDKIIQPSPGRWGKRALKL